MNKTTVLFPFDDTDKMITSKTKLLEDNLIKIKALMDDYYKTNTRVNFDETLKKLNLTREEYINSIRIALTRPKYFLKRESNEVGYNSYNPCIRDMWQANTDLQFTLDPYAAVSYIANYITKDETGVAKLLKEAADESNERAENIKKN